MPGDDRVQNNHKQCFFIARSVVFFFSLVGSAGLEGRETPAQTKIKVLYTDNPGAQRQRGLFFLILYMAMVARYTLKHAVGGHAILYSVTLIHDQW